jgi:hypothetical protein
LLIKIELSLQIKKLDLPEPALPDLAAGLIGAEARISYRSKKVFAFADDCNILTTADADNLANLVEILDIFGKISGLICNIEKTNLLLIGDEQHFPGNMDNLAFNTANELTILGFNVKNTEDNFLPNAEKMLCKIRKQVRIWTRYKLSLQGRISIAKTMMYSQLNYIGCVIQVPAGIVTNIENEIFSFVSGNLRIAKQRVFKQVENGGLGLFNVQHYLDAQACSWVRRCTPVDQDWKARLLAAGTGNLYQIHCGFGLDSLFPVLKNISRAFGNFIDSFTRTNRNFLNAYLLNNMALTKGIRYKSPLKKTDLTETIEENPRLANKLFNLKISDILTPEGKVNKRRFIEYIGGAIDNNLWETLDKIRSAALLRFGTGERAYSPTQSVNEFFMSWKRGSRKIRCFLSKEVIDYIPHNIVKFADNTETIIGSDLAKFLNKSWNFYFFTNELRTFIFKLHNNTLPYNTILSHFVPDITRNCTFCDLRLNQDEEDETPLHLFFNCRTAEILRDNFFKWIVGDDTFLVTRSEFFTVFRRPNNYLNNSLFVVTLLFKKFLWNCKQHMILPVLDHLKHSIKLEVSLLTGISGKMKTAFKNSGLNQDFINDVIRG